MNLARACAARGVRRLVFASSSEIYAHPPIVPTPETVPAVVPDVLNRRFSYSGSKLVGELIVINFAREHGFEFVVLRYHNVYGPRMGWDHVVPQFIARLVRKEPFTVQGDGTQTRAFCYVIDAVDATVRATLWPRAANALLNIGNPEREWTINELILTLQRISGSSVTPIYGPDAEGGTPRRCPDISRARELLEYEPRVQLEAGLAETYRWYAQALARGEGPPGVER